MSNQPAIFEAHAIRRVYDENTNFPMPTFRWPGNFGYEHHFLNSYLPNETRYLDESLRTHLHDIAITGEQERPAGTYGRAIFSRLLIDLSWASSRLEGNTYSRLDTERLIEFVQYAEGKGAQNARMILNHKMIEEEIKRLHQGVIARYRIRPSEFAAWQAAKKSTSYPFGDTQ